MFGNFFGLRTSVVRVQSQQRAEKIMAICQRYSWKIIVGIEPDKPENISDFEKLHNQLGNSAKKTGRNELCFCGSGQKFKRCCDFS